VSILQEHSTPQANLGRDGYLARTAPTRNREGLPRRRARAFRDVTAEVLAAVPGGADDLARFKAIEAQEKASSRSASGSPTRDASSPPSTAGCSSR